MKNNIAFPNKTSYIGGQYAAGDHNTWNLNITPKESDFLSVSDPSMTVTGKELGPLGGALGPRQADGSLPDVDFLKLAKNSQMIDKGVDYGLKYESKAPDLGAYEYGYVSPVVVPVDTTPKDTAVTPVIVPTDKDTTVVPVIVPVDTGVVSGVDSTTFIPMLPARRVEWNGARPARQFYVNGRSVNAHRKASRIRTYSR